MSIRRLVQLVLLLVLAGSLYAYFFWGRPVPFTVQILERLDRNADGSTDTWPLDISGDGKADIVEVDSDADGRVDRLEIGGSESQVLDVADPSRGQARRKLAVCLDGVPFEDILNLWDRGYFREFSRPGKLISAFPSLSDVALTELLHTERVPGYENLYFDVQRNQIAGGATSTVAKVRMPYLDALDYDEPGIFKGLAYVIPIKTFHADLGRFLKRYAASNLSSYTAHICSTDSVCHVLSREEFLTYLIEVDRMLRDVFIREKGQLDFIVFSDHGNSHVQNRRVNLDTFLAKNGFRVESSITDDRSVVIPAFGLVGAMPVYCQPQTTARLAEVLTGQEGVDFTTFLEGKAVRILSERGTASILASDSGKRLKYAPVQGDPLELQAIVERLAQRQRLDAAGFASPDDWFDAAAEHEYADAVNAIYQGVTNHVTNRASLLVSFKDGFHYGRPFFDWLVTMRSTHGNLRRTSMTGFFMRNSPVHRQILPAREILKDWSSGNQR